MTVFRTASRCLSALAFAAGLALVAGFSPASATTTAAFDAVAIIAPGLDENPSASSTPAPTNSPGGLTTGPNTPSADDPPGTTPAKKLSSKKKPRFEHLSIAPTLVYSISTGSDVIPQRTGPQPNALPFDLLRLTGVAQYHFNGHLGVMYQRISHTGGAGRTYRRGVGNYGGSGEDYQDRYLATWDFNPLLNARAGYHYRSRICCPGSDPNGIPRFLGGAYSSLSWRFGPNGLGGKPLTTSFTYEQNYHRFTAAAQKNLVRGDYDHGQKPTFSYTLYSNFYAYHQTKLVPYAGIEYFSTYFSNTPSMSETYRKVYGVAYRATNNLGWKFYIKNDQPNGLARGADASHKSSAFLEATYRFHR